MLSILLKAVQYEGFRTENKYTTTGASMRQGYLHNRWSDPIGALEVHYAIINIIRDESIETLDLHPLRIVRFEVDTLFLPPLPSFLSTSERIFERLFDVHGAVLDR